MPWPLVFAGLWLGTLLSVVGFYAWDEYCDREAQRVIDRHNRQDQITAQADQFTELDREWCSTHHIAW